MSKTKKKSGFGKVVLIIFLVVLTVGLSAGLTKLTSGYTKSITSIFNNKDNLVHTLEEYESKAGKDANGLEWTVTGRGAIECVGEIDEEDSASEFVLGTITIEEDGEYTLSGLDGANLKKAYLQGSYVDAEGVRQTFYGDDEDTCTVELEAGDQVVIKIIVQPGVEVDFTCKPTFVKGDEPGKF